MENHREAYRIETYELLSELESSLLELEENPTNMELIGRVFRAMHTIKGSGAMFGFDDIAEFTHEVETVFDLVRDTRIPITKKLVDLTLMACDQIRKMVDGKSTDEDEVKSIVAGFKELTPAPSEPADAPNADRTPKKSEVTSKDKSTYRIHFAPEADIFASGTNPVLLLDELRAMGECNVLARIGKIPALKDLESEKCYLRWDIFLTSEVDVNAIKDVFIFVEDECEITIDVVDNMGDAENDATFKMLGEILMDRGEVSKADIDQAVAKQKRLGEILVDDGKVERGAVKSAVLEQEHIRNSRQGQTETTKASSIRVSAEKLDVLVDLVGELVTVQARLSQKATFGADPDLLDIAEVVERLTAELRDNTMSIRMLPIGSIFSNLKRLVRDLSHELGKDVMMETEGGDTELDKTIIEHLKDPLVHIIRNSIDHGIEPPNVRDGSQKPKAGIVKLSAEHSGASVLIKIADDGAGLDPKAIQQKAIDRGLIAPEKEMSEKALYSLIFAPGFSTAGAVTNVSGRGVGMDVVKRSMESLRGNVEVESILGKGTTIILKLPLTLAIIDGLLVETGGDIHILPVAAIEECVELTRQDVAKSHGRNILNIRGEIVPYVRLRERFDIAGHPPDIEQVIINEVDGQRVGIVVDRVIGEHQIVIKTMSKLYQNVEEISGATILGDGTVALILNIPKLIEPGVDHLKQAA